MVVPMPYSRWCMWSDLPSLWGSEEMKMTRPDWHYKEVIQPILDRLWSQMREANDALLSYRDDPNSPHAQDWRERRNFVESVLGRFS